jgi:hypothetical protein
MGGYPRTPLRPRLGLVHHRQTSPVNELSGRSAEEALLARNADQLRRAVPTS